MSEPRNLVFVGASGAGLLSAHNTLKHVLPALKAKKDAKYHVYLINPSPTWFYRIASPRAAASTTRMAAERLVFDIKEGFKQYSSNDFTFIEAAATGLDTAARTVSYKSKKSKDGEQLTYHSLVIATGSNTYYQAFSQSAGSEEVLEAIQSTNKKVTAAKDIVIVGGGPTAIEFAAEVAEHRNGKAGWFSDADRKVNITLITATDRLLTTLRPAISKTAASKLNSMGVDIVFNTRVTGAQENSNGRTTITLAKGDTLEADLYVPAHGVSPNSSWLPTSLLDSKKYINTNPGTLRVDAAGPRVYAFGDVASYSRNNVWDVIYALPTLAVNMKRDLLAYNAMAPDAKPRGKDRVYTADTREVMAVPMGTQGGVGAIMGWRLLSWVVWALKGRDYMVGMSGGATVTGETAKKEVKWSSEEAAI